MTIVLWIFAVILIVAGLAGMLVPVLPGPIVLWVGLLLGAWAGHFAYVGLWTLGLLLALALLAHLLDFIAGSFGTKRYGASGRAAVGAAVGAIIGIFFGLIGVLVGPFVGAVIGELTVQHDLPAAGRAGYGATLGMILGAAAKLALGVTMVGIFAVMRFV